MRGNWTLGAGRYTFNLGSRTWDWRLNITKAIETVSTIRSADTRLDLGRTFSAGALVFRDRHRTSGSFSGTDSFIGSEGFDSY